MNKTAQAFDLDVIKEHESKHAQRHTQGAVQISSRDYPVMHFTQTEPTEYRGKQIDRQKVH